MKTLTFTLALMGILAGGCTAEASTGVTEEPVKEEPSGQEGNKDKNENDMTNPFNFETRTVKLNSGWEMPIIGIGTYYLSPRRRRNPCTTPSRWACDSSTRLTSTETRLA